MGMEEDEIGKGLNRLHRLNKLTKLDAPPAILEDAQKRVAAIRAELGEEGWNKVLAQYPEFSKTEEDFWMRIQMFEDKCKTCEYWIESWESHEWCKLFKYEETSSPDPCPKFKLRVF